MKTIPLTELFTEQQLKGAAKILGSIRNVHNEHKLLVEMLEPDKSRFDSLKILVPYAAYVLEWQRDRILEVYG